VFLSKQSDVSCYLLKPLYEQLCCVSLSSDRRPVDKGPTDALALLDGLENAFDMIHLLVA
jgi:hypothetical protein